MKNQPNRNYKSNDDIQTPIELCKKIVWHFRPIGIILEPCKGDGNFISVINDIMNYNMETYNCTNCNFDWCEIKENKDFMKYNKHADWIITNPPWSKMRAFLKKSFEVADNVVFLMTINHVFTKARIRDMKKAGFGIKEIRLIDTPKEFPNSGFQLGAVYFKKGYNGYCTIGDL